jgi:hypothetical protein
VEVTTRTNTGGPHVACRQLAAALLRTDAGDGTGPISPVDALAFDIEELIEVLADRVVDRLLDPCVFCPPVPPPRWPGDVRNRPRTCLHKRSAS